MVKKLSIETRGQGLHDITREVAAAVAASGTPEGLCTLFIRHTSASLTIQENADPSARRDLEAWLNRLVPENDPLYTHKEEGPDDMPSHIKTFLTATLAFHPHPLGRARARHLAGDLRLGAPSPPWPARGAGPHRGVDLNDPEGAGLA